MLLADSDSQVNVNWVFAELDLLDDCCSRRLLFSWPLTGVIGEAAASAMAADIMPWSVVFSAVASIQRLEDGADAWLKTYGTFTSSTTAKGIVPSVVKRTTSL